MPAPNSSSSSSSVPHLLCFRRIVQSWYSVDLVPQRILTMLHGYQHPCLRICSWQEQHKHSVRDVHACLFLIFIFVILVSTLQAIRHVPVVPCCDCDLSVTTLLMILLHLGCQKHCNFSCQPHAVTLLIYLSVPFLCMQASVATLCWI